MVITDTIYIYLAVSFGRACAVVSFSYSGVFAKATCRQPIFVDYFTLNRLN